MRRLPAGWTSSSRSTPATVPRPRVPSVRMSAPGSTGQVLVQHARGPDLETRAVVLEERARPGLVGTHLALQLGCRARRVQAAVLASQQARQGRPFGRLRRGQRASRRASRAAARTSSSAPSSARRASEVRCDLRAVEWRPRAAPRWARVSRPSSMRMSGHAADAVAGQDGCPRPAPRRDDAAAARDGC